MAAVHHLFPNVSSVVAAALLLAARTIASGLGLTFPTASEILDATGAGRSRAYEIAGMIPSVVAGIVRPPGRPVAPPKEPAPKVMAELSGRIIDYLIEHPGCVTRGARRRDYNVGYRRFVLDLFEERHGLELNAFAQAVAVPLPTLREWLRGGRPDAGEPPQREADTTDRAVTARIETILDQWKQWRGSFVAFCEHLREHLRIEYGRTLIASILEQTGARLPKRRPGRSPDEVAMRGAFETFFPGAQWEGDGSPIVVRLFGHRFVFNVEAMVDAASDAVVGCSIRDHEDADAVIEAFNDGVMTTGAAPIALELDGRPSNHADEVDQALGDTLHIHSTPGRPTTNPHVEGAFGLFQQAVPELTLEAQSLKEAARRFLAIVFMTWARTLNHKPRTDRGGLSRVQLSREQQPTAEQIEHARQALRERCRRQEAAMATRRARQDPVVREVLDSTFERLGLDDPKGNVRAAIARYPLDHVVAGIATYEGKRDAGRLPPTADVRYLLGIVRNISDRDEGLRITEALIKARLQARDLMLAGLVRARDQLLASTTEATLRLRAAIDRAMSADRCIDRLFWLDLAASVITEQPEAERVAMMHTASRRIHATFAVPYEDRLVAVRYLARKVVPLV